MSKLDRKSPPRVQGQRNVFDLSHDILFTAAPGMLLPVSHDLLMPGDSVKGKFDYFLRTMPLSTAAMVDVNFYTDYFFVPIEMFFVGFDAWFSRTNSNHFPINNSYLMQDVNTSPAYVFSVEDQWPTLGDRYHGTWWLAPGPSFKSIFTHPASTDCYRLADMLGLAGVGLGTGMYGKVWTGYSYPQREAPVSIRYEFFPWQYCAYQAIYQWYYRDDEFEPLDIQSYTLTETAYYPSSALKRFALRYRNRMDDYYTSYQLSPLLGRNINQIFDWNTNDVNPNSFTNWRVFGVSDNINGSFVNIDNQGESFLDGDSQSLTSRSTAQLRALFAQEKLVNAITQTRRNYDAQVMSRFGFDVPKDIKHNIQHLGHDVTKLDIREIQSGANTFNSSTGQGSSLGDLAGKGYAVSGKKGGFKFTAPVHGVLMTIFSYEALPKYICSTLRKDTLRTWDDFFQPEYDNLGLQPVYQRETAFARGVSYYVPSVPDADQYVFANEFNPLNIVGWQYRYTELKRNVNRATMAFANNGVLGGITSTFRPAEDSYLSGNSFGFNAFTAWSKVQIPFAPLVEYDQNGATVQDIYKTDIDYYSNDNIAMHKVAPWQLDDIMLVKYSYEWKSVIDDDVKHTDDYSIHPWLIYQTDPVIVDGRFNCTKISRMSVHSMPKFL